MNNDHGKNGQADYNFDVFIGYFCSETNGNSLEEAKKVREELRRRRPRFNIYFFPDDRDRYFDKTPEIIRDRVKAFLLVGNGRIGKNAITEKIDLDGRSVSAEIAATNQNEFMCWLREGKEFSDSCAPARLLSFDGGFTYDMIDAKQVGGTNPFFGTTDFNRKKYDKDDDFYDAICAWLDKVAKAYAEFYPDNDVRELPYDGRTIGDLHVYWVGTRQSDADCCTDLFFGSVCLFGENDPEKKRYSFCKDGRIDHNAINQKADMYVFETVMRIAERDKDAYFYCYNQGIVYNTKDENGKNPYERVVNGTGKLLLSRFLCLNEEKIVNTYSKKDQFRELCIGSDARTIPCKIVTKEKCRYLNLLQSFQSERGGQEVKKGVRFVLQAPTGSGGVTTFILSGSKQSEIEVEQLLQHDTDYICTVYQEDNVPVNVHALIFENTIWLSTPSIQLLSESGKRLMYRGADFIEYKNIPKDFRDEFLKQARSVCDKLRIEGYRGVCGIDGIICNAKKKGAKPDGNVFLMEANMRFQASTGLLNRGLAKAGYPSLQHLNLYAFYGKGVSSLGRLRDLLDCPQYEEPFPVKYANYSYVCNLTKRQAFQLLPYAMETDENRKWKKQNHVVAYELDGLNVELIEKRSAEVDAFEYDAYLYRIVFDENLCWVNNSSRLYVNENVVDENLETYSSILANYCETEKDRTDRMIRTKVALLIQGANVAPEVREKYGLRPGTFQSVDIVFRDADTFKNYVVNAPIVYSENADEQNDGIRYTGMTPFLIDENAEGGLSLLYYGQKVDDILLMPADELQNEKVGEIDFSQIAYLSTDRLRVHLTNHCKFKRDQLGCKFCGIQPKSGADERIFSQENIEKVLRSYVERYGNVEPKREDNVHQYLSLRHFLLGGQTANLDDEKVENRMLDTIRTISEVSGEGGISVPEIYAMIVPCSAGALISMKRYGLTQVAYNLEVWDDDLAEEIMPGKRGKNGRRQSYLEALGTARRIMRKHESVRSMLLIGLEPVSNTEEGIRQLLAIDVQPMLSVFRPMPGTEYSGYMSPPITEVVELFDKAEKLCKEKQYRTKDDYLDDSIVMHLGPDCKCCQNNTVALPYEKKETKNRRRS